MIYMYDNSFEIAIAKLKMIEGGYANHPDDPGGKTKYGITEWLARKHSYQGEMKDLTWDKAKEIYNLEYWSKNNYGKIDNYYIAEEMLEQAVNLPYVEVERGKYKLKANLHLQRAYNLVTLDENKHIVVDGLIGPQTLKAINSCPKQIGLYNALNVYQGEHYIYLAEHNERYKSFIVGWLNNRIEIIRK